MPTIALLFASLHALLLVALSAQVSRQRYRHGIATGDGGDAGLARRMRVQANFVEYVPMALLLLALLEAAGLPAVWTWAFGATLLLARVMHAVGYSRTGGRSFGRFWGTALTWADLLAMACAGIWLALR